ncbi:hypothetical protein QEH59_10245 [Coraliomargarita sp. SDUM461004]|uniref:Uncharacterized protein n=1 Tax=Thalassobacterium sedimentorum TaxID=3041258 RepID=A0ABU1AJ11_9BACT|nr:hypothetical protein [Coraliomargarita sp. SDUM461004]MDQ8194807.1 hypothetical protein [Coraliomargarita sp. SDUM461004]
MIGSLTRVLGEQQVLQVGAYSPGENLSAWRSEIRRGSIESKLLGNSKVAALQADDLNSFVYLSAPLVEATLGKSYEVTVYTFNTTTAAQLIVTEGFIWGEPHGLAGRYFRSRGTGDGEMDELRVKFEVNALPAYVNIGILDGEGEMTVQEVTIREISRSEALEDSAEAGAYRDISREQTLRIGLVRFDEVAQFHLENPQLSSTLREALFSDLKRAKAIERELELDQSDESLARADLALSEFEKITVFFKDEVNPDVIPISRAESEVTVGLMNLFLDTSVWARLESSNPAVNYRQVIPGTSLSFDLNEGDLINLPVGEMVHLRIIGATEKSELTLYPLDHFGSDVRRSLQFVLQDSNATASPEGASSGELSE